MPKIIPVEHMVIDLFCIIRQAYLIENVSKNNILNSKTAIILPSLYEV